MPACDALSWDNVGFARQVTQAKVEQDWGTLKKLLARVAEHNYRTRSQWQLPTTVPVSFRECQGFRFPPGQCAVISFSTMSTADALLHFGSDTLNVVCGLSFANGKDVGGGYKHGSSAQEEDLCRRIPQLYTTLHQASESGLYPFGPSTCTSSKHPEKYSDVLYSRNLVVGREGEEQGFAILPAEQQVTVSLVSAAAPNVRFAQDVDDDDLVYQTMFSIFVAPKLVQREVTTLVLGAWGCGAFGGNPEQIAKLFIKALVQDNLGQLYREVHFAIPRTSQADENYDRFRGVFASHRIPVVDGEVWHSGGCPRPS